MRQCTLAAGAALSAARLAVTCADAVHIDGLADTADNGTGTLAVAHGFIVTPPNAACTADPVAATVTATATATGTLDIEVECKADHHATSTATAQFRADDQTACVSPLGVLRHGTRTFASSLSATSCISAKHPAASTSTFRAHRYSFTLASSGWVSVDLEPTGTGRDALDTYLLLLGGHGSGGTALHSHNNLRGDATALDGVYLTAGDYTIEATTALPNATGGYRIAFEGDFAVQSDDLPATVTATVGQTAKARFDYLPHDAAVTVQSVSPEGLTAAVTALHGTAAVDLAPDKARTTTITLAFAASGHTSTQTLTVNASCQTGFRPSPDGTCVPLAPELDESCFQNLPEGRTNGFGRQWATTLLSDVYGSACTSVSVVGKAAAYFRFDLPATETSRSSYEVQLDLGVPTDARPFGGVPRPGIPPLVPEFSVVVWQLGPDGTTTAAKPLKLVESQHPAGRRWLPFLAEVKSGSHVIEVAVPEGTESGTPPSLRTANKFTAAVTTPSAPAQHVDVRHVGNTGVNGSGMTLAQFLDARGTISASASKDNPFEPASNSYPWLAFNSDGCTIPDNWLIKELIGRYLPHYVAINDALQIVLDPELSADENLSRLLGFFRGKNLVIVGENIEQENTYGGVTVPFYFACHRHDFNWRNLHRVENALDRSVDSWTTESRGIADGLLFVDLARLCTMNAEIAATSKYFDWVMTDTRAKEQCLREAIVLPSVVQLIPMPVIDFYYPHELLR